MGKNFKGRELYAEVHFDKESNGKLKASVKHKRLSNNPDFSRKKSERKSKLNKYHDEETLQELKDLNY